jgi:uncharacterized membrane protein YphA (DoxX/SURF4 family)
VMTRESRSPTRSSSGQEAPPLISARALGQGMAAVRILIGLVFLSNGLAKLFNFASVNLGFFSFTVINRDSAKGLAGGAAQQTYLAPLRLFYQDVVLPNWGIFGAFLTVAELSVGLGLLLGIASRLAAVGGLLLIGPIWLMLWHTGLYLWEYPLDVVRWRSWWSCPVGGYSATTGAWLHASAAAGRSKLPPTSARPVPESPVHLGSPDLPRHPV